MTIHVQVEGLEEVQRRLSHAPELINGALRIVVKRAGLRIRRESREIMPGTVFDRSIIDQSGPTPLSRAVGSPARSAESIQEGRRPGRPPSVKALSRWVQTYGLAGAVSLKTRRQVGKKNVDQRAVEGLAWALQARIRRTGTKPIPFIRDAIGPSLADVKRYIDEAVAAALKKL